MIKKIEGIIVSEVDYKETSKIINILTKEDGLIGVIAKGAKRMKSPLSSVSSKLTNGYFYLNWYNNKMPSLIEVDIINNFKNIKTDLVKSSYSLFLLELSHQVYKHENNNNIYNLLISSINKIEENFDPQIISNILELKLLEYLGIKPVIDKCVSCGSVKDIVTISSHKGGYLCKNCLNNDNITTTKTIKLIRMFYYVDISKITKLEISEPVKQEINNFIDDYYDRYSGLYLKSKAFLKQLNKIGG
jgi:DNA repair protein RecO (recombination protein O)